MTNLSKPAIDLAGQRFGRLVALKEAAKNVSPTGKTNIRYLCKCDCGSQKSVLAVSLRAGRTKSCGCMIGRSESKTKHGNGRRGNRTGEYNSWAQMRSRCNNQNVPEYKRYGGRGIKVCDRWESFEDFLADMGPRPEGYSIERIDVNGNYEPSNCRWASGDDQRNNTRRSRFLEHQGRKMTVAQWSAELGISQECISGRLRRGWTIDEALK